MIDATDSCPGCGASWYGAHGAFGCGYPSADCGAMVAANEKVAEEEAAAVRYAASEREFLALQAEEAALTALLTQFLKAGCPLVDGAPLDELEAEQDARRDRFFRAAS